ncbi:hypothetical protein Nepgr_029620 [Nepenthes gracilis]|uniref:Uncharacterized protein n=1 Tax=Nepenthes gracilis TaxID=150966 RepID=A0AAD3Y360_NEPGR|nr:hypothetical protein Nepgr_029620 [Nepenthes gracilis]
MISSKFSRSKSTSSERHPLQPTPRLRINTPCFYEKKIETWFRDQNPSGKQRNMPDSQIKNSPPHHPQSQKDQNPRTQNRLCDFCGESVALLFCRADSAKLCLACDREVHSANPLFSKHIRWLLCDACDSSSASIFCFTDRSVLCQNCDHEFHISLKGSPVHDRRSLEGFSGCPTVSRLSSLVGFADFDAKSLPLDDKSASVGGGIFVDSEENNEWASDLLVWDTPAIFSIDELIASTDKGHNFQALGVPTLPKDRNLACGQHKQEVLRQLCQLVKVERNLNHETELALGNQFTVQEGHFGAHDIREAPHHDVEPIASPGHEASSFPCSDGFIEDISSTLFGGHFEESALTSDRDLAAGSGANLAGNALNPSNAYIAESMALSPRVPGHEFRTADRDSALSRYKEKKRTRRYEKHIRYESRKALAEGRTRIKGRFAKMDHSGTLS